MDRPRVLFVSEAVTLAHIARPLALAHESRERLDIMFAADPSVHDLVIRENWEVESITSVQPKEFMRRLRWGECVFRAQELRDSVCEDLAVIRNMRPDVVVGDFRLSLSISCRLANIPYIALGNAYWHPDANLSVTVPELPLTKIVGVTLGQWIFDRLAPSVMALHGKIFNRVRDEFGMSSLTEGLWKVYLDADVLALVDLPQCYPDVQQSNCLQFIGPCVWMPPVQLPTWWDSVPDSDSTVFVCLGSSGQMRAVGLVVDACLEHGWNVLLATSGRELPKRMRSATNLFVADFLPGLAAMRRSQLLICNGGSPMCQLAMSCGKPVIGVPSNLDQFLNMAMVKRVGMGVELRPEKLGVTDVKSALTAVSSNPGLIGQLEMMAQKCAYWGGRARIADLICDLI